MPVRSSTSPSTRSRRIARPARAGLAALLLGVTACGGDAPTAIAPWATARQVAAARSTGTTAYRFDTFLVCPGCPTSTAGINDAGLVAAAGPGQGYVYDSRTGTATPVPGALVTTVPNARGQVPALAFGPGGTLVPMIREADGTTQLLAGYPGAPITAILELHPNGESIGWASLDFVTFFSFIRSRDGRYERLAYPGPVGDLTLGTFLLGWNQRGTMVGYLADPSETKAVGVVRDKQGAWTTFVVPGALATVPYAIDESGTIVGTYRDAAGWHGFVSDKGALQTVDYPGAANTALTGVNNRGQVVGFTFDEGSPVAGAAGVGFVATPSHGA